MDRCQAIVELEDGSRHNEHNKRRSELQLIAWFALNRRIRYQSNEHNELESTNGNDLLNQTTNSSTSKKRRTLAAHPTYK